MNDNFPMHVNLVILNAAQLTAVYALLGGSSLPALTTGNGLLGSPSTPPGAGLLTASPQPEATVSTPTDVSPSDNAVDAAGWPWSEDLHASTKNQTKEGLWRMKVGVSRPDPKPGFPKDTGTGTAATTTSASEPTVTEQAPAPVATTAADDDDEFAAFHAVNNAAGAADASAAASVPARKWSDADLSALCNQAAVKLGDPSIIKGLIAEFVPAGEVPHSRNIPADKREAFAKATEAKAGIEFVG